MARPLRVEFEGAWYHVMNRGAGHRRIFLTHADRTRFLRLLGEASEIFGLETHTYCLMDNHYHLLVCTPDAGLSRAMRHLNGVYAQYFNRRNQRDGPLFRGRYAAFLVGSDAYRLQASRYIHLNPVDAGIVRRPEAYPHSSYRAYLEPSAAPAWLVTSTLLGQFGPFDAGREYRRFIEQGIDEETREFHEAERMEPVFGDDSFKTAVRARVEAARRHAEREIPDARRLRSRPNLTAITHAAAAAFGVDTSTLTSATHARGSTIALARLTALYLARHEGGMSLASIAAALGYRSYNAASTALTRFRRRLNESDLHAGLQRARSLLYKVET